MPTLVVSPNTGNDVTNLFTALLNGSASSYNALNSSVNSSSGVCVVLESGAAGSASAGMGYTYVTNLYAASVNGVCGLNAPVTITPTSSGSIGSVRVIGSSGTGISDQVRTLLSGSVGIAGSGHPFILSTTTASNGVALTLTNATVQFPLSISATLKMNASLADAWMEWFRVPASAQPAMANSGTISVYSGTAPATADTALSGNTLLCTFSPTTSWWAVASQVATMGSSHASSTPVGTGTATFFRWTKGAYTLQGSVGTAGADFVLSSTAITSGGATVNLTEATINF